MGKRAKWDEKTIAEFEKNIPPQKKITPWTRIQAVAWNDLRDVWLSVVKSLREENHE